MRVLPLLLACLLALPMTAHAEEAEPEVIVRGFKEYVAHGSIPAIDVWLTGSARETDDRYQDEAAARMNAVRYTLGRPLGYELVKTVTFSPSTKRLYAAVKFDKGVAWMYFDCYKPGDQWIVTRFEFQRSANLVLPPNILGGN